MKAQVYMNLRTGKWSVRSKETGRVVNHADQLVLHNARFVVREGGRQRTIKEGQKNVHAFIEGDVTAKDDIDATLTLARMQGQPKARYNPYHYSSFVDDNDNPVKQASKVALSAACKEVRFQA